MGALVARGHQGPQAWSGRHQGLRTADNIATEGLYIAPHPGTGRSDYIWDPSPRSHAWYSTAYTYDMHAHARTKTRKEAWELEAQKRRQANTRQTTPKKRGVHTQMGCDKTTILTHATEATSRPLPHPHLPLALATETSNLSTSCNRN